MNDLLVGVLDTLRRTRSSKLGVCAVCRRKVTDRDRRTTLRAGAVVHRECATYRARRGRDERPRRPAT
jgi:hypothetical protein